MKKSQNFTTPKQSQRLLELGIPADSADMYFQNGQTRPIVRFANSEGFFERNDDCSPCWSVGQLIDILKMVTERGFLGVHFDNFMTAENNIESLIHALSLEFPRYKKKARKSRKSRCY